MKIPKTREHTVVSLSCCSRHTMWKTSRAGIYFSKAQETEGLVPAEPVSVEHTLADFQITIFLLCPHMRAKKEKIGSRFSSKNTNPIHVTLASWPNYLSKASSPNAITLETWATHMNLRGHIHSIQRGVFCWLSQVEFWELTFCQLYATRLLISVSLRHAHGGAIIRPHRQYGSLIGHFLRNWTHDFLFIWCLLPRSFKG